MQSVLILNATYQPLSIVSAFRAVTLVMKEKATPLDLSTKVIRSEKTEIVVPYVILLKEAKRVNYNRNKPVSFSRRGVLVRDDYTCVYCGDIAQTIDHVVPQAAGGLSTFDNCVAACFSCNSKKGDKSLKQMGWTLNNHLMKVPSRSATMLAKASKETAPVWEPYLKMFEHSY